MFPFVDCEGQIVQSSHVRYADVNSQTKERGIQQKKRLKVSMFNYSTEEFTRILKIVIHRKYQLYQLHVQQLV